MTISNIVIRAVKQTIKVIKKSNLDYCLFGGLAMQVFGRIRATKDVDIMIAINKTEISKFISRMEKSGFKFDHQKGLIKLKNFELLRFIYTDKNYLLDIFVDLVTVNTEFQRQILKRKRQLEIWGININFASCEDLVLLKILAKRPIDIADAKALIKENIKNLNKTYLQNWAKKLGVVRQIQYLLK